MKEEEQTQNQKARFLENLQKVAKAVKVGKQEAQKSGLFKGVMSGLNEFFK